MAHVFNNQKRNIPNARHLIPLSTVSLVALIIVSTCIALTHTNKGKAVRAAGTSFTFTAAGDYAQSKHTTANLSRIVQSGASFNLALGDFDYSPTETVDQWSNYVKSQLPAKFPFEIIPGEHDVSQLSTLAADLPDHIGTISGTYAQEYYFDYPATAPLARFIMTSPGLLFGYDYTKGSAHYRWMSTTIDNARAANIPWIVVGMYKNCFGIGTQHCLSNDLLNLLITKKVDLILYAHKHDYQASKQLAFNGTTCTNLTTVSYNADCVVNSSTNMTKGAGSVIVITGTGGASMISIDSADPALGYFRAWEASNINPTWGISQFAVSATQITMKFVGTSGGTFANSFTLHA